jgi:hypothetical protein
MPNAPGTRYVVDVNDRSDQHGQVDQAWVSLVAHDHDLLPDPPLYLHGTVLSRIAHDEERAILQSYREPSLLELLSRTLACWKWKSGGQVREDVPVPTFIAKWLLAREPGDLPGALRINRITDVPIFDAEEQLHLEAGYSEEARTYYAPAEGLADMPRPGEGWHAESETAELATRAPDVEWARETLLDLIADFPFEDEADRAHAICMMIEPFVRELVGEEGTPLYAVRGTQPGTGKSKLARICLGIGCGPLGGSTQAWTTDGEELRKRITAILLQGQPAVFFDNVPVGTKLDSGSLAAALTSPRWRDRELGASRMIDVPIRNVWVVTGNNLQATDEIQRRIIPIRLAYEGGGNPRDRTGWRHEAIEDYAREHRRDLVIAATTLVQHWLAGHDEMRIGEPYRLRADTFLAGYARWGQVMGGILTAAGIPGFLGNLQTAEEEMAMGVAESHGFIADLYDRWPEEWAPAQEWSDRISRAAHPVSTDGEPVEALVLPSELLGKEVDAQRVGVFFRSHRNATLRGGYRVEAETKRHTKWRITKAGTSS